MTHTLQDLTAEQLAALDKEVLVAIILEMREQIAQMASEIQALTDQLAKNSQNSGKPPSSDGLKKPSPKSLREKGKRARGGQAGHPGQTLKAVETPDYIVPHGVENCGQCGTDLRAVAPEGVEKRQVFDVPRLRLEVTEYQGEVKRCPACGCRTRADFPAQVTHPVQYGARLKAQAVYLTSYHLLPLARTCELLGDLYGQAPCEALLLSAQAECAAQTEAVMKTIQQQLRNAAVIHCDETGMRVEGHLNWLHVASTRCLTYYTVQPKRGQTGMQAMGVLPGFRGRVVHDAWSPYFTFAQCQHALCNAHHLRELTFIEEQYQQAWAGEMGQLLAQMKRAVDSSPAEGRALPPEVVQQYAQAYDRLLAQGLAANPLPQPTVVRKRGRRAKSPARNLLERLQRYQEETLAFLSDFRVPFDNNQAERDVRMMKVKQKISGAFRTRPGADTFCRLRSYISTVRKHGRNVIQALLDALLGQPFTPLPQPE